LRIKVKSNSSNIIDELWEIKIRSEFCSRTSELGRSFEVRRIGDPLFLRTRIGASSSNIINELWGNEDKERSAAKLVNSKGR